MLRKTVKLLFPLTLFCFYFALINRHTKWQADKVVPMCSHPSTKNLKNNTIKINIVAR